MNVFFHDAYKHLMLPKFAVYHSEENVELYKDIIIPEDVNVFSSESAQKFISRYSKRVFDICMNMDVSLTIEPWHIKALLRFVLHGLNVTFVCLYFLVSIKFGSSQKTLRFQEGK